MQLRDLAAVVDCLPGTELGDNPDIAGLFFDSRQVVEGSLFFAVPGESSDGHDHIESAMAAGAAAVVVERPSPFELPQIVVESSRAAMAPIAAAFHDNPSQKLTVVGVTGTNGKTTTVSMIAAIAEAAGLSASVIGTLTGARTTPEAIDLQAQLAQAVAGGVDLVAMEVSSHALVQHRADCVAFAATVFTNLSVDHLDYHESMDDYFAAKARLFAPGRGRTAVIWVADDWGVVLADQCAAAEIETVRVSPDLADVALADVGASSFVWCDQQVDLPMGGRFNVANALLAAETALALDIAPSDVASGLTNLLPVPGRFELVEAGQAFGIVVDYSHTPDSLEGAILAAKDVAQGRVLTVFGAGGDRDRSKRPMMGEVAHRNADLVVVTSDNPRSEDPMVIIEDVVSGMAGEPWLIEVDRRSAIEAALREALPGDVVLLAGKGHETTQTIGAVVSDFDDRAVAREILASLAGGAA